MNSPWAKVLTDKAVLDDEDGANARYVSGSVQTTTRVMHVSVTQIPFNFNLLGSVQVRKA